MSSTGLNQLPLRFSNASINEKLIDIMESFPKATFEITCKYPFQFEKFFDLIKQLQNQSCRNTIVFYIKAKLRNYINQLNEIVTVYQKIKLHLTCNSQEDFHALLEHSGTRKKLETMNISKNYYTDPQQLESFPDQTVEIRDLDARTFTEVAPYAQKLKHIDVTIMSSDQWYAFSEKASKFPRHVCIRVFMLKELKKTLKIKKKLALSANVKIHSVLNNY
jgi:hypothetical protein